MKENMKILELCEYSAGICGTFARVKQEAELLSKNGHEVRIFSSNLTKGTDEIAKSEDKIGKVLIRRFPSTKLGGESFIYWNFEKEALELKPDVIIAHVYRHIHTSKALRVAEKLGKQGRKCKVFLVSHASFTQETRSILGRMAVGYYDKFIGPGKLKKFDKIIHISNWEVTYLLALGVEKGKLEYVPNGILPEYFGAIGKKEDNKILFLGRVSPIKDIETLIKSLKFVKTYVEVDIVGPAEEKYLIKLKDMLANEKIYGKVNFLPPIYDINEKIKKIDSCKVFVLPSKREGMSVALIEALARKRIVIASDNPAAKDLIQDGKNGFLFGIGNEKALAEKIDLALSGKNDKIRVEARKSVLQFSWDKVIKKLEKILAG